MPNTTSNTTIDIASNLLQSSKFAMTIERIPNFSWFLQKYEIPDVSIDEVIQSSPITPIYHAGTRLYYGTLDVEVLADENLRSWYEIYSWLSGMAPVEPNNPSIPVLATPLVKYSNIIISVLNNSNVANLRFQYFNCHPIKLGKVKQDTTLDPGTIITFPVSFRFTTFKVSYVN